jgi:hypothetical protein
MFSAEAARAARGKLSTEHFSSLQRRCPEAREPAVLEGYIHFLALKVACSDYFAGLLSPPLKVDAVWHAHLLDTLHYEETCTLLGVPASIRVIHHNPDGGDDAKARRLAPKASAFGVSPLFQRRLRASLSRLRLRRPRLNRLRLRRLRLRLRQQWLRRRRRLNELRNGPGPR